MRRRTALLAVLALVASVLPTLTVAAQEDTPTTLALFDFEDGADAAVVHPALDVGPMTVARGTISFFSGNPGSAMATNTWDEDDNYFQFVVVPPADGVMLTELRFDEAASGTGPDAWIVSVVDDPDGDDPVEAAVADGAATGTTSPLSFSTHTADLAALAPRTQPFAVRIHGREASGSAGTWRIDNVTLSGTVGDEAPDTDGVVITAMRTRGPGGAFDEYVEIRNVGSSAVDISGWRLQGCALGSGAPGNRVTVPAGTAPLPPGGYFLFVNPSQDQYSGGTAPDLTYTTGIADGGASGARIVDADGTMVSGVGTTSTDPASQCAEGGGWASSFPTSDPFDVVRVGDRDNATRVTGVNAEDFFRTTTTPRNSSFDPDEPPPAGGVVVISQVYGGGGNTGAPAALYTHDFIELFNRGGSAVSLDGWSVQYASATGTTWQTTNLTGTIEPGQYYLVQQAQGSGGSTPLPAPDATGSINMAATNGKVALAASTTQLSGTCPLGGAVLDFVGYGSTANCFEGTGPTPTLNNNTSAVRADAGCQDTDDNAADFTTATPPTPRNTSSPLNLCDGNGGSDPDPDPEEVCEVPDDDITRINEIQGDGAATPLAGERVVTRGVVTSDFTSGGATGKPSNQGLRGFHIEAMADDRDDDPMTSEGLFVFESSGTFTPELGTLVHVLGDAGEAFQITQVSADVVEVCDDDPGELPPPAELPLPTPLEDRAVVFEALESMRVVHDELTLVEFFQLERFGEVRLSSAGVLANPTNVVSPHDDDAYEALVAHNSANNIILDDGRSGQNLDPLPFLEPGDTLRIGDQVSGVPAIMHFGFNNQWRLQPVSIEAFTEAFQEGRTRPRPETPPEVGGSLTVTAFNVLNYFNGDGYFAGDDHETAQGFPTARGAVTPSEFDRQTEKIVDAITRMDADIVGLIEIENDEGERQAAAALVDALNTALGAEVYAYVDTGTIGTDAIKLAYIYQVDTVVPVGDHAILDSSVDPRFNDQRSRPVLAQTFQEVATGESVTVANNHLKSKGSGCGAGDDHPRQGSCNLTRTLAAEAMVDWLASNPTGVESRGNLIVGDLNAYAKEDPIEAIRASGYTDLLDAYATDGQMPYTFTFDATQGYLDYALADPALVTHVTGAAAWNINADEVPAIDYLESCCGVPFNQRFRTEEVAELYYDDSAFRSSDHDPVLVGLDLTGPPCGALPPTSKARPCRGDDPPPGHAAKGDRLRR